MHPHSLKLTCSPTPTPVHTHTPRASQPECMLLSQQPQQEHPTKKIDNPSPGYIKFTFPPVDPDPVGPTSNRFRCRTVVATGSAQNRTESVTFNTFSARHKLSSRGSPCPTYGCSSVYNSLGNPTLAQLTHWC